MNAIESVRIIDLTHPIRDGQGSYPGDPVVSIHPFSTLESSGYRVAELCLGSHHGAHVDAPSHVFPSGKTVDQIPLEKLVGAAQVVDLAPGSRLTAGDCISMDMLAGWRGRIRPGSLLVIRTGWDIHYGTPEYFQNWPILDPEVARWFASIPLALLGMDTPSPEYDSLEIHRTLLGAGCETALLENLTNLDQLPEEFFLAALPLPLVGVDGSSVRAIGIVGSGKA